MILHLRWRLSMMNQIKVKFPAEQSCINKRRDWKKVPPLFQKKIIQSIINTASPKNNRLTKPWSTCPRPEMKHTQHVWKVWHSWPNEFRITLTDVAACEHVCHNCEGECSKSQSHMKATWIEWYDTTRDRIHLTLERVKFTESALKGHWKDRDFTGGHWLTRSVVKWILSRVVQILNRKESF